MESGMGAGASGHGMRPVGGCGGARGGWRRRRGADDGLLPSRGDAVRIGTTFPAPLAADMRTGSLAARWFTLRNGYGGAQHVSW